MSEDEKNDGPRDRKLVVYVSTPMLEEIDRRSVHEGEEGESRGFVVRKALREHFRRHPMRPRQ